MSEKYAPPKPTIDDDALAASKIILSAFPILGGPAIELINHAITPALEIRRNEWMVMIGEALERLENEKRLSIESLKNNDLFIDMFIEASRSAIRTSQKEKHAHLRNVLLNSVLEKNNPKFFRKMFLLNHLQSLDSAQILILNKIYKMERIKRSNTSKDFLVELTNNLNDAFESLNKNDIHLIIQTLISSNFINKDRLDAVNFSDALDSNSIPSLSIDIRTEIGTEFLQFISSPFEENN